MAYRAGYEILCSCGEKFHADLCEYIFTEYDPELRDALLGGELNMVACPACGEIFPAENRLLYRDEKNKLWVWMCRKEEEPRREELAVELLEGNLHFKDHFLDNKDHYRKHLVFGRNALIALLLRNDRELRKKEGPRLRKNPGFRMIMKDAAGGLLFLIGDKVRVALPLTLPSGVRSELSGAEERTVWFELYSRGLNIHNPFSSFLSSSMKAAWRRILKREPMDETMNEWEAFARSWAGHEKDPLGFEKRFPLRARFFEDVEKVKVTREIHPFDPSMDQGEAKEKGEDEGE